MVPKFKAILRFALSEKHVDNISTYKYLVPFKNSCYLAIDFLISTLGQGIDRPALFTSWRCTFIFSFHLFLINTDLKLWALVPSLKVGLPIHYPWNSRALTFRLSFRYDTHGTTVLVPCFFLGACYHLRYNQGPHFNACFEAIAMAWHARESENPQLVLINLASYYTRWRMSNFLY